MTQDILRIKNMTFHAYHGVWEKEREVGQRFEVDLEAWRDIRESARTDKLKDTVDLYAVFQAVEDVIVNNKFNLVETMAERVASRVLLDFALEKVRICVRKPHPPIRGIQDGIQVEIVRERADLLKNAG